jgi:cytochrome bd-type quinol oxidase subunit 2
MFVLFYFTVGDLGIGTISSIKSPILTKNEKEDAMTTVRDVWVKERTKLVSGQVNVLDFWNMSLFKFLSNCILAFTAILFMQYLINMLANE